MIRIGQVGWLMPEDAQAILVRGEQGQIILGAHGLGFDHMHHDECIALFAVYEDDVYEESASRD